MTPRTVCATPVEQQRASDNRAIGSEALPPQNMTQDGGRCGAGALVIETKAWSESRRPAQTGPQVSGDRHHAET